MSGEYVAAVKGVSAYLSLFVPALFFAASYTPLTAAFERRLPYSPASARAGLWVLRHTPSWIFWNRLNKRLARAWLRAWEGRPPAAPPRLTPDLLEQLAADRYYDTSRLRALGFSPRWPSAIDGLLELASQSRAQGLLPAPHGAPALPGPRTPEVDTARTGP